MKIKFTSNYSSPSELKARIICNYTDDENDYPRIEILTVNFICYNIICYNIILLYYWAHMTQCANIKKIYTDYSSQIASGHLKKLVNEANKCLVPREISEKSFIY
jgi:hypothetical protein